MAARIVNENELDGTAAQPVNSRLWRPLGRRDLDATRLCLRLLRNGHFDDAVAARRMHARCVDGIGQREAPVEATVRALDAAALHVLARRVLDALAAEAQHALVQRDLD